MSPDGVAIFCGFAGFPRVSGDEPLVMIDEAWAFEFSPRERG